MDKATQINDIKQLDQSISQLTSYISAQIADIDNLQEKDKFKHIKEMVKLLKDLTSIHKYLMKNKKDAEKAEKAAAIEEAPQAIIPSPDFNHCVVAPRSPSKTRRHSSRLALFNSGSGITVCPSPPKKENDSSQKDPGVKASKEAIIKRQLSISTAFLDYPQAGNGIIVERADF